METSEICSMPSKIMNNKLPLGDTDPTLDYVSSMITQIHAENSQILDEFVTEDEIDDNFSRKGENDSHDSLSLDGSCASAGTLSGISTCSAFSLSALKSRKNQLINSIKSQLNSSMNSENTLVTPDTSIVSENVCTSTPFSEIVPPAAKFLKEWKSSFGNYEDIQSANEDHDDDYDDYDDFHEKSGMATKYEEAFSSLREILSNSQDNILDAYENTLDEYKTVNDKKFEEMLNFFSEIPESWKDDLVVVDADGTLTDDTIVPADSNDNTVIAEPADSSEKKTELPDDEKVVDTDQNKELPEKHEEEKVLREKETDTKDPENLIIGGEELAGEITPVDEERLLASDDELPDDIPKNNVPQGAVKDLEVFISDDAEENRDNNDPKWNFLRTLGSDYERFQFVHKLWNNFEIPNPKKDLTCRCRGITSVNGTVSNSAFSVAGSQSRKRSHSPPPRDQNNKRARREACTMLYDRSIEMLFQEVEEEKSRLEYEQEKALNRLADCQHLEQFSLFQRRASEREVQAMKMKHFRETESLIRDFRQRYNSLVELSKQKIGVLREAAHEVREFHEFYPDGNENNRGDKNSLVYLNDAEVEEILEIETMLMHFETFYDRPSQT